jgi:hypothetical protein
MLLSWPLFILLSYFAVRIALFFYEERRKGIEK